jgi:hypothetical protein
MNRIFVSAMLLLLTSTAFGQIIAPNQVIIFEHNDFVSPCGSFTLTEGRRHKLVPSLGSCNDKVSSILVGEKVLVRVFKHADFKGHNRMIEGSTENFSDYEWWKGGELLAPVLDSTYENINDQISSLIIFRRPQKGSFFIPHLFPAGVKLNDDTGAFKENRNQFFPLPELKTQNRAEFPSFTGYMNDRADRIFLSGDVRVTVWEHSNFQGDHRDFPGMETEPKGRYNLETYQFKDKISSLVVEAVGDEAWQPPARGTASDAQTHRAPTIKPHVGTIITPQQPVKADAQGPAPAEAEPPAAPGVGREIPVGQPFELDTNRPGHDYKNFDLPHPEPELCRDACLNDPQCRAFTYIKPGVQGPNAHCWLKKAVPPAEHAPCCISGVVR